MRSKPSPPLTGMRTAAWKAAVLVVVVASGVLIVRFTPLQGILNPQELSTLLNRMGLWAPAAFVGMYVAAVCLFIPSLPFTTLGALAFGACWGFVYAWLGAVAGACGAFLIGRYLGRDFIAALVGGRLARYDEAIERNGFATVLYMRLMLLPFTPLSFGLALTKVRFRDYFWGTALGMVSVLFALAFLVDSVKTAWMSGQWDQLLSWKVVLAAGLYAASIALPRFARPAACVLRR